MEMCYKYNIHTGFKVSCSIPELKYLVSHFILSKCRNDSIVGVLGDIGHMKINLICFLPCFKVVTGTLNILYVAHIVFLLDGADRGFSGSWRERKSPLV